MNLLQKSILSTIAYYDTLDYPLTSFEVFKYLVNPLHVASFYKPQSIEVDKFTLHQGYGAGFSKISLVSIRKNLNSREMKKFIDEKNGFYFLKNRTEVIRTRIDRQKIADQKWKKAKKIIRWLQIVPYLRMVAVSGSLALNNTQEESDIDILVIVRAGRIWLARFFVTVLLQLIGKRRHKKFTKDRICLNHYITNKSLEIKFRSLYNAQTYAHMIPVLETEQAHLPMRQGIYNKFQKANRWIKDYLVFWPEIEVKHFKTLLASSSLISIARAGEICLNNWFGDLLEKLSRKLQKSSIEKDPLTHKKGGRITTDDTQLEFHPESPERKTLNKYNKNMLYLGVGELSHEKDSGLL